MKRAMRAAWLRHSRARSGSPSRAGDARQPVAGGPAHHAENVCTRALPRSSHRPASGWSYDRERAAAERLQALEQRDVAAADEALVEEHVRRGEDRGAVDVVLHLPVRVVADAHRPHAAIAGQRVHDLTRRAPASPLIR